MFCSASSSKRPVSPARRAESPSLRSSGPRMAKSTPSAVMHACHGPRGVLAPGVVGGVVADVPEHVHRPPQPADERHRDARLGHPVDPLARRLALRVALALQVREGLGQLRWGGAVEQGQLPRRADGARDVHLPRAQPGAVAAGRADPEVGAGEEFVLEAPLGEQHLLPGQVSPVEGEGADHRARPALVAAPEGVAGRRPELPHEAQVRSQLERDRGGLVRRGHRLRSPSWGWGRARRCRRPAWPGRPAGAGRRRSRSRAPARDPHRGPAARASHARSPCARRAGRCPG